MIGDNATDRDSANSAGVAFLQVGWSSSVSQIVDSDKYLRNQFRLIQLLRTRDAYMPIH